MKSTIIKDHAVCSNCGTISEELDTIRIEWNNQIFATYLQLPKGWFVSLNEKFAMESACSEACAVALCETSLKSMEKHPRFTEVIDDFNKIVSNKNKSLN